jgi:quercetin dioxygenase-like cupin family protein
MVRDAYWGRMFRRGSFTVMRDAQPTVGRDISDTPHVAGPGGERSAWYLGWLLTFLATGDETGGQFSLTEVTGRRDSSIAPPLHVHTREEECFYVVDGAITCHVGDEVIHVPAGAFIVLPRGVPHRYELATEHARLLNLCVPAGFEGFYRALSEPAAKLVVHARPEGAPDVARLLAAATDYGVEIIGPPPPASGA